MHCIVWPKRALHDLLAEHLVHPAPVVEDDEDWFVIIGVWLVASVIYHCVELRPQG